MKTVEIGAGNRVDGAGCILYGPKPMELKPIRAVALQAATQAGDVLRSHFGNLTDIRKKGVIDLVTEADLASEWEIISTIREAYPDHGILAEESGEVGSSSSARWIIDPLDGTTNFAHGLGIFSVSIAFALEGELQVGVVYNPVSGELFEAEAGSGAFLNGRRIAVSRHDRLEESLLVTGSPYCLRETLSPLVDRFSLVLAKAQGVRRLGSAALDLCFVACGRFDGFWEEHLKPWDTAAGTLILREAGGIVTDFSNSPFEVRMQEILATNGKIHAETLGLLASDRD